MGYRVFVFVFIAFTAQVFANAAAGPETCEIYQVEKQDVRVCVTVPKGLALFPERRRVPRHIFLFTIPVERMVSGPLVTKGSALIAIQSVGEHVSIEEFARANAPDDDIDRKFVTVGRMRWKDGKSALTATWPIDEDYGLMVHDIFVEIKGYAVYGTLEFVRGDPRQRFYFRSLVSLLESVTLGEPNAAGTNIRIPESKK